LTSRCDATPEAKQEVPREGDNLISDKGIFCHTAQGRRKRGRTKTVVKRACPWSIKRPERYFSSLRAGPSFCRLIGDGRSGCLAGKGKRSSMRTSQAPNTRISETTHLANISGASFMGRPLNSLLAASSRGARGCDAHKRRGFVVFLRLHVALFMFPLLFPQLAVNRHTTVLTEGITSSQSCFIGSVKYTR
jgi:hypothetical protein